MTLATVTPIPGTARPVYVAGITLAERRQILQMLADFVIRDGRCDWPERFLADQLALYADPRLRPAEKTAAFCTYVDERSEYLEVRHGTKVWANGTEEVLPDGRHEDPLTILLQNMQCALADLAGRDNGGN
jgi:hypothetical protein